MSVALDGELHGSIGGGMMEVNLVERARDLLSEPGAIATEARYSELIEQVHQKHSPDASGMICSGRQTVILKSITIADSETVSEIIDALQRQRRMTFEISNFNFELVESTDAKSAMHFSTATETDFCYREVLGSANELTIIGGGHCALALSEIMSKLDFRIRIFDDRPQLNTIQKNQFANEVAIIDSYENIGEHVRNDPAGYVVVMTLGYVSDAVVIRQLIDREFGYFGVLGSRAKMATLMKELRDDGLDEEKLLRIHTPIGVPINSQTPDEIAISIAAEIIAVKNQFAADA